MKNQNIIEIVELSESMIRMADRGMAGCEEDKCFLIYGLIRDCAYKIKQVVRDNASD